MVVVHAGTCPFGTAHVDTPKGDLDGSAGALTGYGTDSWAKTPVNDVYGTFGTTELYPDFKDSSGSQLTQTAHAYAECSNKGLCDRATGLCACITGYEGHACQRGTVKSCHHRDHDASSTIR